MAPTGPAPDPGVLGQWTAAGRLALAADGEGGSGAFNWEQRAETTRLDVRGPFGAGALQVVVTPAVRRDMALAIQGVGTAEAKVAVRIAAKITGRLVSVRFCAVDEVPALPPAFGSSS
jgi:outer membrane biogenesis lipoprotein LolB